MSPPGAPGGVRGFSEVQSAAQGAGGNGLPAALRRRRPRRPPLRRTARPGRPFSPSFSGPPPPLAASLPARRLSAGIAARGSAPEAAPLLCGVPCGGWRLAVVGRPGVTPGAGGVRRPSSARGGGGAGPARRGRPGADGGAAGAAGGGAAAGVGAAATQPPRGPGGPELRPAAGAGGPPRGEG